MFPHHSWSKVRPDLTVLPSILPPINRNPSAGLIALVSWGLLWCGTPSPICFYLIPIISLSQAYWCWGSHSGFNEDKSKEIAKDNPHEWKNNNTLHLVRHLINWDLRVFVTFPFSLAKTQFCFAFHVQISQPFTGKPLFIWPPSSHCSSVLIWKG